MSITEINILKEKVEKDPNSRLYVPLAEEYRKEGMLDEAIEVLQKGLERHPGYMSARVSLGKIYHAKGQMDEARNEFESVIKSIPDNLYAHKKLAEIYKDTGKKDLAIRAFRTVLKLNPMDEETLNSLRDLEGASAEQPLDKPQETTSPSETMVLEQSTHDQPKVEEPKVEEPKVEEPKVEEPKVEEPKVEKPKVEKPKVEENEESVEELDAFKDSLFGVKSEPSAEIVEEMPAAEENAASEAVEIPEKTDEQWSFGDAEAASGIEAVEEEAEVETVEISEEADEGLSFGDVADVLGTEGSKAAGEVEDKPEDRSIPTVDKSLEEVAAKTAPETDYGRQKDKGALLQTADGFISEGKYLEAINIYQQVLAADAGDKQTLQRIEELRALLKLMGKDKEVLISKLSAFLGALKKRGDEFHRDS